MSLVSRINSILRKLDDPDCVSIAEKEIKALIVNEIDNGEKLNVLIIAIADDKNYSTKKTQYAALKLFQAVAEIFQHQILEFLPKVFAILNKKITTSDETVHELIAEAYAGVIEFSFKGADSSDANFVLHECLKQLYELFDRNVKSIHVCAGLCVSKMLQTCEISILEANFENIYRDLTVVLKVAKEKYTVVEAILTLVLSISAKVSSISEDVIGTVLNYVGDANYKTRKICIDVLYAILSIDHELLKAYNDQMYKVLQELKTDKNKFVREAAMECINLLSAPSKSAPENINSRARSANFKTPANNNPNTNINVLNNTTPINVNDNTNKNAKFVRKTSSKFVNRKLNLEHVTSTIDKTKFNKAFASNNNALDEPVILVKEPKNLEQYQRMQQITEENLIRFMNENGDNKKSNKKIIEENGSDENVNEFKRHEKDLNHDKIHVEEHIDSIHVIGDSNVRNNESQAKNSQPVENLDINDKKEIENLKKYIKILNGKIKEISMICSHLTKTNNDLVGKVALLEQNYGPIYALLQKNNLNNQDQYSNDSYLNQSMKFATPDRTMSLMASGNMPLMSQNNMQPQYQHNMSMLSQNTTPTMTPSISQVINPESNKWLNKTTNVNTKLFNILAANNDDAFFNFLRDSANYNNFGNIDQYLTDQLYVRLVDLLTRTANNNSIVAEYTLKWLHLFLNAHIPNTERDIRKLQSLLFYLSNNVEDTFLKEKVMQVLNHDHFNNNDEDLNNLSYA